MIFLFRQLDASVSPPRFETWVFITIASPFTKLFLTICPSSVNYSIN